MNAERLSKLFVADIAVCVATPKMYDTPVFDEEYATIRKSVPMRQREFAAGRAAARTALEKLGIVAGAIPSGVDRAPIWPEGFVGSISHCQGFCCSVVGNTGNLMGLGIDVELNNPLIVDLRHFIFSEEEIYHLAGQNFSKCDLFKVGFCAKEAFYKCYYPLVGHFLDFRDVSLNLECDPDRKGGKFEISVNLKYSDISNIDRQIIGRWFFDDAHIYCGATLPISTDR